MIRTLTLHVDIETGGLLDPATWYARNDIPEVRRGDTVQFQLVFHKLKTANPREYEDSNLEDAGAYFVGVKQRQEWAATEYLAETETIVVDDNTLVFSLVLTSATLATKLTGSTAKVECVLEVPYTDEDGEDTLASFRIDILNDYVKGTEGDPAPSVPIYYTAAQVAALLANVIEWFEEGGVNKVRIKNSDGVTVAVLGE